MTLSLFPPHLTSCPFTAKENTPKAWCFEKHVSRWWDQGNVQCQICVFCNSVQNFSSCPLWRKRLILNICCVGHMDSNKMQIVIIMIFFHQWFNYCHFSMKSRIVKCRTIRFPMNSLELWNFTAPIELLYGLCCITDFLIFLLGLSV